MKLEIECAIHARLGGIVSVSKDVFPQDFIRDGKFDPQFCRRQFEMAIDNPFEFLFAAIDSLTDEVLGFAYYVNKSPSNGTILLEQIGVKKELQGQGIGRKLLTQSEEMVLRKVRELGIKNISTIHLTTSEDNPAGQNLYVKAGYKLTGKIEGLVGEGNVELVFVKKVSNAKYRKNLWSKAKK